jgi:hypothetical protein
MDDDDDDDDEMREKDDLSRDCEKNIIPWI